MPEDKYVFISYSTKDLAVVNSVLKVLKDMRVKYWKAPEGIPAGSSYAKEIVSALSNCSMVLVFLSANAQASQWVEKEIDGAVNYNKRIIPLMIDDAPMNGVFRFYLNNVQMIFYSKDPKAAIEELKKNLREYASDAPVIDKRAAFLRTKGAAVPAAGAKRVPAGTDKTAGKAQVAPAGISKPAKTPVSFGKTRASAVSAPVSGAAAAARRTALPRMKPVDFSSKNRRPVNCVYCSGGLEDMGNGVYRCISCGGESYDDFTTIRRYISENGPAPVAELARALGIPRDIVNDFRDRNAM